MFVKQAKILQIQGSLSIWNPQFSDNIILLFIKKLFMTSENVNLLWIQIANSHILVYSASILGYPVVL